MFKRAQEVRGVERSSDLYQEMMDGLSVKKSYFTGRGVTIISQRVWKMSSLPRGKAAAYARIESLNPVFFSCCLTSMCSLLGCDKHTLNQLHVWVFISLFDISPFQI